MEEQASQDKGGRDPFHLAPHPNLGGLPDTSIETSRFTCNLLLITWLRLLSGRELQRVRRVSLFVSLPTHRSRGMSAMWWPWRTPACSSHSTRDRGILMDFSDSWATHLFTHPPRPCRTPTSSPIVIAKGRRHHRQGNIIDPSPEWSGFVPFTSTHCLGLAPPSLSHTLLLRRPPANCCPHSAKSQHPGQGGNFLQDLSYSTRTAFTCLDLRCPHARVMQLVTVLQSSSAFPRLHHAADPRVAPHHALRLPCTCRSVAGNKRPMGCWFAWANFPSLPSYT